MAAVVPAWALTDDEIMQEIQALKDRITQLEQQLDERNNQDQVIESQTEVDTDAETANEAPSAGRALQLPDISAVGNVIGLASDNDNDPNQNQFTLEEFEIALQGAVYPGINANAIVAFENEEDFNGTLEEGYANITSIGGSRFGSRLGKLRAPIGKFNPIHPHQLPYADTPAVYQAFLGDDGLLVQGAELSYLFPGNNFTNLQFGQWRVTGDSDEDEDDELVEPVGLSGTTRIARLWTSRELSDQSELELGSSLADSSDATLYGVDVTFKKWPSAFQRLYMLGELLFLKGEDENEARTKYGYYLLGAYQPDKYWEYGARYDWTKLAFPLTGRESAGTAFLTRRLNETTFARLQYKRSNTTGIGNVNEAFLQFVFGFGPHAHPLQ
jgi:hypothetical protein